MTAQPTVPAVSPDDPSAQAREVFARRESAVRSYCRGFDAVLATARGSVLRDVAGREYLDFLAGAGSLNYGHNHPRLREALLAYVAGDGIAHGLDLHTVAKQRFLETFESRVLAPRGLPYRVQFTGPTGANAVEAALKLARKVTGRRGVVAFTDAFHGVSLGALAATGNRTLRMAGTQPLAAVDRFPYDGWLGPDVDTAEVLARYLDDPSSGVDAPAAVLLETVQGEGGLAGARPAWLRRVAEVARAHGSLLVVDDVQAGCGRTGPFFSFEGTGVVPDLVVLSKSLSGYGLPMSALLVRPEHDAWEPGEHNGTFRGNAHAFVTAEAAVATFWADGDLEASTRRRGLLVGERLDHLARLVRPVLPRARVRGRGLMLGLDLGDGPTAERVRAGCVERGLLLETCGPRGEVVKLLPPLTTPDDLLADGLDRLEAAVVSATRS